MLQTTLEKIFYIIKTIDKNRIYEDELNYYNSSQDNSFLSKRLQYGTKLLFSLLNTNKGLPNKPVKKLFAGDILPYFSKEYDMSNLISLGKILSDSNNDTARDIIKTCEKFKKIKLKHDSNSEDSALSADAYRKVIKSVRFIYRCSPNVLKRHISAIDNSTDKRQFIQFILEQQKETHANERIYEGFWEGCATLFTVLDNELPPGELFNIIKENKINVFQPYQEVYDNFIAQDANTNKTQINPYYIRGNWPIICAFAKAKSRLLGSKTMSFDLIQPPIYSLAKALAENKDTTVERFAKFHQQLVSVNSKSTKRFKKNINLFLLTNAKKISQIIEIFGEDGISFMSSLVTNSANKLERQLNLLPTLTSKQLKAFSTMCHRWKSNTKTNSVHRGMEYLILFKQGLPHMTLDTKEKYLPKGSETLAEYNFRMLETIIKLKLNYTGLILHSNADKEIKKHMPLSDFTKILNAINTARSKKTAIILKQNIMSFLIDAGIVAKLTTML